MKAKFLVLFWIVISFFSFSQTAWTKYDPWFSTETPTKATFSQIKYYTVYSKEISATLFYSRFSPDVLDKFFILANVSYKGKNFSMFKPFDAHNLRESSESCFMDVDDSAGIIPQDNGSVRLFNNQGKIQWNLLMLPGFTNAAKAQYMNFPSDHLDEKLGLQWNIFWKPENLDGKISGTIKLYDNTLNVNAQASYHDDTYGNWNFLQQPFFWFYFSGNQNTLEGNKKKYHVLFADMYEGKKRTFGLKVYDESHNLVANYLPGTYRIRLDEIYQASSFKFHPLSDKEENTTYNALAIADAQHATHEAANSFVLETNDKKIKITLKALAVFPYFPILSVAKIPVGNWRYGSAFIDDLVVEGKLEMQTGKEVIKMGSIGGLQYLRKASSSVHVLEEKSNKLKIVNSTAEF